MNIPVYIYRWYWFGAIDYVSSEKTYNINGVTITLPWGWYNPFHRYSDPLAFFDFKGNTNVYFEFYGIRGYEHKLSDVIGDGNGCYYADVNGEKAYVVFSIPDSSKINANNSKDSELYVDVFIPDISMHLFFIYKNEKTKDIISSRILKMLSNISVNDKAKTKPFDIDARLLLKLENNCTVF